ncbi:MAG: hypothetical protein CAF45_003775 [Nitrospira sp. CG24E]|nr:MAG: hypothetical protein CAF45_003775 [Nitrospira sp. CG24E]
MLHRHLTLAIIILSLGWGLDAFGQQATEMFIPLGQSPGLSKGGSVIGTLESMDPEKHSVTVVSLSGAQTVGITDRTMIWLDLSQQKQPNRNGAINDLQQGRRVEVKVRKGDPKAVAEWIKVQVSP